MPPIHWALEVVAQPLAAALGARLGVPLFQPGDAIEHAFEQGANAKEEQQGFVKR